MPEPATADIPRTAAVPRHAASLIVLRDGPAGPETLMGMRGAGHRFMPNCLVFPGGAVDPGDSAAPAATEPRPEVTRRLQVSADPALARGLAIAAARELAEETGLTLGAPPRLDGFDYLCRAVTPAQSQLRFDARFLAVDVGLVSGRLAGSGELEGLRWVGLAEVAGLELAPVTHGVIQRLRDWLAMTPQARRSRARTPLLVERTWRLE